MGFDLAGRTVMVTGASRGIGAGYALRAAREGADVVLVARSADDLADVAARVRDDHEREAEVLVADLVDPEGRATVVERLVDEDRPIDMLVNNAGFGTAGQFHELDVDRETRLLELNVLALLELSHAAVGAMRLRGAGALVNLSSITAFQAAPNGAVYGAGKAFVKSFTESLAEELRGTGVRVQALCPGFTRTDIFTEADADTSAVPDVFWQEVDEVVDASLKDLGRGIVVSVPGVHNRALSLVSWRAPGFLRRPASAWLGRRFL